MAANVIEDIKTGVVKPMITTTAGIEKGHSITTEYRLGTLFDTPIRNFGKICTAIERNYPVMEALMELNILQLNQLISYKGAGAPNYGDGTQIEKFTPQYALPLDYVINFQKQIRQGLSEGYNNTTAVKVSSANSVSSYRNNQIYKVTENLYPDENGTGTFENRWKVTNQRSILDTTQRLFREHKINTIISAFHTYANNEGFIGDTHDNVSKFGKSHGKNLLTREAEMEGKYEKINGYNNPYCRVWTHHHQYDNMQKLIRPFAVKGQNGTKPKTVEELNDWSEVQASLENGRDLIVKNNQWAQVSAEKIDMHTDRMASAYRDKMMNFIENPSIDALTSLSDKKEQEYVSGLTKKDFSDNWGWRNIYGAEGRKLSVLNNETGQLNIAPQYKGGGNKNIHTKDCMFSIENLAWQGYDPYSFENALSWEQRGPFGGRIMWFPPYGLTFNEDTAVNWTEQTFIGRGEPVYTYTNTVRSGTLGFMMVVDHPSIIDYATWYRTEGDDKPGEGKLTDTDLLRYFAGCDSDTLKKNARPTPLTDEYLSNDGESLPVTERPTEPPRIPDPTPPSPDETINLSFYVFFPNNYSGLYDAGGNNDAHNGVEPIAYLLAGLGTQMRCNESSLSNSTTYPLRFEDLGNREIDVNSYVGYEMSSDSKNDKNFQDNRKDYIIGTDSFNTEKYVPNKSKKWYYRIDGEYKSGSNQRSRGNTYDQKLVKSSSYYISDSDSLNSDASFVKSLFSHDENEKIYSLAEIAYVLAGNVEGKGKAIQDKIKELSDSHMSEKNIEELTKYFDISENSVYKIEKISGVGYSNEHGHKDLNEILANNRFLTIKRWFCKYYKGTINDSDDKNYETKSSVTVSPQDKLNTDGLSAKKWRSAKITLEIKSTVQKSTQEANQTTNSADAPAETEKSYSKYIGFVFKPDTNSSYKNEEGVSGYYISTNKKRKTNGDGQYVWKDGAPVMEDDNRRWIPVKNDKGKVDKMVLLDKAVVQRYTDKTEEGEYGKGNGVGDINALRYDQEYYFFKQLEKDHKTTYNSLIKKLGYFLPAYHSMTPEGFNGRLTFLQQCTRQGNTIGASDKNGKSANNLAFGRPPFCILRLGDFYYQKIVIKSIQINYDPLVLDLNPEGIGVQPLIANVNISFNFVGGGDLAGPVRRLQNAMTANYYANARLYDNRADRVQYHYDEKTNGALNHDLDLEKSYFYDTQMQKS